MRRAVEAPYPRGEETKARILDVAVQLFGFKGFDSVSTREIAANAAVPQASLRYYFGNKQGLYIACLEHIQAQIFHQMEPALTHAEALLDDHLADVSRMISSFCDLQDAMAEIMIGGSDGGSSALLLLRHDLPSQGGAGSLSGDETAIRRMASCFARTIVRISDNRFDEQSASRIAGLINGQITNIYLRRSRLQEEGWDITPERLTWVKRMIRMHTTAILQLHAADGNAIDGAALKA